MPTTPVNQSGVFVHTSDDLPISKEATTSRVLVNNELLRHVMFAMDKGQVLTDHSSPRAVIVNILQGRMRFTVAGVDHEVVAGDVIYLAPDERHAVEALEPSRMGLTLVITDK